MAEETNSNLSVISKQFRDKEIARNSYKGGNQYVSTHKDALSDGDEKGKGEKDGSIGSKTDIDKRETLSSKNKYSKNKPYEIGNA